MRGPKRKRNILSSKIAQIRPLLREQNVIKRGVPGCNVVCEPNFFSVYISLIHHIFYFTFSLLFITL